MGTIWRPLRGGAHCTAQHSGQRETRRFATLPAAHFPHYHHHLPALRRETALRNTVCGPPPPHRWMPVPLWQAVGLVAFALTLTLALSTPTDDTGQQPLHFTALHRTGACSDCGSEWGGTVQVPCNRNHKGGQDKPPVGRGDQISAT